MNAYCWFVRPRDDVITANPNFQDAFSPAEMSRLVVKGKVPSGRVSGLSNYSGPQYPCLFVATLEIDPPRVSSQWLIEPATIRCNITLSVFLDHKAGWIYGPYPSELGSVLMCDFTQREQDADS